LRDKEREGSISHAESDDEVSSGNRVGDRSMGSQSTKSSNIFQGCT